MSENSTTCYAIRATSWAGQSTHNWNKCQISMISPFKDPLAMMVLPLTQVLAVDQCDWMCAMYVCNVCVQCMSSLVYHLLSCLQANVAVGVLHCFFNNTLYFPFI